MASYSVLSVIENLNSGNFIESHYDSEHFEYVATFKHSHIDIPNYCYIAHYHIYDGEEDKKVCRIEVVG